MTVASTRWIKGPLWDGFFMLSALWLAPIVWFVGDVSPVYLVLTLAFWIGHRVSSSYLAYCTSSYRPLLTSQRTRFIWVPLAIAAAVLVFLVPGDDVWPWPRATRVLALVIIDAFLITYHFASQHYGVLSLYRLRAGHARDARAKRIDRWFALGVGGVLVFLAELLAGTLFFLDDLRGLVDASLARALGTVVVVAATAAVLAFDRASMSLPRALYLTSVSMLVLAALWVNPLVFVVLWTVQHWTAATGLATVVARNDVEPGSSRWYRAWHALSRRPAVLLAFLVVVSAALFPLMEVEAAGDVGPLDGTFAGLDSLVDALAASAFAPLLVAFAFVTAFVHYQLDRAVFRFSHPDVRRAAALEESARAP